MLIQLKQKEIEAALKLYIGQQGIGLAGKKVEIAFTAGRKESGLSAEVDISDASSEEGATLAPNSPRQAFPDTPNTSVGAAKPVSVMNDVAPSVSASTAVEEDKIVEEQVEEAEAPSAPLNKATSLFG